MPTLRATTITSAAAPPRAGGAWPPRGLRLRGQGSLRFLGMLVYEAELAVAPGFDPAQYTAGPLALRLRYRRPLAGRLIAERSLAELRRAGPLDAADGQRWLAFMLQAFPDVQAGDTLTGLWQPGRASSRFLHGTRETARCVDAAFGRRFFGIWLATHSSAPALRAALLGLAA